MKNSNAENTSSDILLRAENLTVSYGIGGGVFMRAKKVFNAVDGVSFEIKRGEIMGLVGESGSGKTTTGRAIIRLAPISSGKIFYGDTDITTLTEKQFMPYRKKIQMIFQDPFNSLNPRMSIYQSVSEPLAIHFPEMNKEQRRERVADLLKTVGLEPDFMARYPHEFSGGQRQRIGIARALAVEPEFIICDEPVSALDVSVQAQIVNLLEELRQKLGLTMLFIAHDIAVVEYLCDRMMVMTCGKIVESGISEDICANPQDAYTKRLIASVPRF